MSSTTRAPPRSAEYQFNFSVPRAVEVHDKKDDKTVVYYEYEVEIKRTDANGVQKTHSYGGPGQERFRKRWSELDAFDSDWATKVGKVGDDNPLHDELKLGSTTKYTAALRFSSSIKSSRQQRFTEYINALMSEPKLHNLIAKFLAVPLEVLAPPIASSKSSSAGSSKSTVTFADGGGGDADDQVVYTKRKIKRKAKPVPVVKEDEDDESDEEDEEEEKNGGLPNSNHVSSPGASSVAAASNGAHAAVGTAVSPVPSNSGHGASSSTPTATPKPHKVPHQYLKDGHTPNPKWHGPTLEEWTRLEGMPFLKIPHQSGFLSTGKAKVRTFSLWPLNHKKAQAKLTVAKKEKKSFALGLDASAFIFTYDSSKDALESIFILGDQEHYPWTVTYDQSTGEFAKQKKDGKTNATMYGEQVTKSLTITYGDGSQKKTLDLIAEKQEDYDLLKAALTFIKWREAGILKAVPLASSPTPPASAASSPVKK